METCATEDLQTEGFMISGGTTPVQGILVVSETLQGLVATVAQTLRTGVCMGVGPDVKWLRSFKCSWRGAAAVND